MEQLGQFIGRFHPVLVHIPVGMVFFAVFWEIWSRRRPHLPSTRPVWILAAFSICPALLSGFLLKNEGGFDVILLKWHQFAAFGTAAVLGGIVFLQKKQTARSTVVTTAILSGIGLLSTLLLGQFMVHGSISTATSERPAAPGPPPAPANAIAALQNLGVMITPLSENNHALSLNCINAPALTDSNAYRLEVLAEQIVWLKLGGSTIHHQGMAVIGRLRALQKLGLENMNLGDSALLYLNNLPLLESINLNGNPITGTGVGYLKALPALKKVYLFNTAIKKSEFPALFALFPRTQIDTGYYQIPFFPEDTARLVAPMPR
jgi:hypothetical protein